MGFAAKRGRKNLREEAMKKGIRKADNYASGVVIAQIAVGFGAAYFLSLGIVDSEMRDLCPELTAKD